MNTKKTIIGMSVALGLAVQSGRAQFIVDTPIARAENTLHHIEQILKIVQTIKELRETKDRLGDASSVAQVSGAAQAIADLGQTSAIPRSDGSAFAVPSTPGGEPVNGDNQLAREQAIFQAVANYDAVREQVVRRSDALKVALKESVVQAQAAGTHAEVLKVNGVIAAEHAAREAAAWELDVAAQQAMMLDIQNRAAKEAAEKTARQEQSVDLADGLRHFTQNLRPPSFISTR